MEDIKDIGNLTLKQFKELCQKIKFGHRLCSNQCPLYDFCETNGFGDHELDPRSLWFPKE